MPGLLGLLGASGPGLALAPALRVLTYPFLALTVAALTRGWYLESRGHVRTPWGRRSRMVLVASTALAAILWALRFAGALGAQPF